MNPRLKNILNDLIKFFIFLVFWFLGGMVVLNFSNEDNREFFRSVVEHSINSKHFYYEISPFAFIGLLALLTRFFSKNVRGSEWLQSCFEEIAGVFRSVMALAFGSILAEFTSALIRNKFTISQVDELKNFVIGVLLYIVIASALIAIFRFVRDDLEPSRSVDPPLDNVSANNAQPRYP